MIIECPKADEVIFSICFGFNADWIFFEIFFARVCAFSEISDSFPSCFFGIISTCPLEAGFISRTAKASSFSSIL